MRIIVNKTEHIGGNIIVTCNSGIGTIKGIWCGKNPPANSVYHVEFTLADIDCEHIKILSENKGGISVSLKNDIVFFKGICEDYDGEIHYIRFTGDWLQMIYIDGNAHVNIGDNILFELNYNQIEIYPYDII